MTYKEKYLKYLKSEEWASIKLDLIQINNGKCERCGRRPREITQFRVRHLTYANVFNEQPGELELLCSSCLAAEYKQKQKKGFH